MGGEQVIVMTRVCSICGYTGELFMPAEDAGYGAMLRWGGALIQECYPNLSPTDREQLLTGTHPECWDKMAKECWDKMFGED